jgi:hypothetical protein
MSEGESELKLRARLRADLEALRFDDWLICTRAQLERAFGPPPDYVALPAGFTVLDEGEHTRDVKILREARFAKGQGE